MAIDDRFAFRLEDERDGVEIRDTTFLAVPFDQRVRAVCASCNGGWMSAIEAEAKPLLERLMRAEGGPLTAENQTTLAAWALLKACAFGELSPENRVVPTAHREHLFQHRRPPPCDVWVWLGSYEVRDLVNYAYQGILLTAHGEPDPTTPTVYFVTITVGTLVVHVAGSLVSGLGFGNVPGLEPLHLQLIWPVHDAVDFDQRHLFTHDGLVSFSKLLYNVVGRLSGGAPPAR